MPYVNNKDAGQPVWIIVTAAFCKAQEKGIRPNISYSKLKQNVIPRPQEKRDISPGRRNHCPDSIMSNASSVSKLLQPSEVEHVSLSLT